MKLLFNSEDFSEDFKLLLGFVDADFKFENMRTDLTSATRSIIETVGKEVYAYAEMLYWNPPTEPRADDDINEQFLYCIRLSIALDAYRMYAPNNDLSHTTGGRKMRNQEMEKNAFEWMIDKDDESLLQRYFKSVDNLLFVLDTSKVDITEASEDPIEDPLEPEDLQEDAPDEPEPSQPTLYQVWTTSSTYTESFKYFIRSTTDFDDVYHSGSRLLVLKLRSAFQQCENLHLVPLLGSEKVLQLKELAKTNFLNAEPKDIQLLAFCKSACVFYGMQWGIPKLSIFIFPDAIVQKYKSDRQSLNATKTPMLNESQWAKESFNEDFQRALTQIRILTQTIEDFTETPRTSVDKYFSI